MGLNQPYPRKLNRKQPMPFFNVAVRPLACALLLMLVSLSATAQNNQTPLTSTAGSKLKAKTPPIESVTFTTDLGDVTFKLHRKRAPQSVKNFLAYAKSGFYNGTIFHRVIPGFVVQGGGLTFDFVKKATRPPVVNESIGGLRNKRATIAMARLPNPDSATAQFFVNLSNNRQLNANKKEKTPGYTVFASVEQGMTVIQEIARQPRGQFRAYPDAPNTAVRILATRLNPSAP